MANLKDIFNLAKADGGKFFVIDDAGDVKLVIMNVDDYERMLIGKVKRQVEDVEKINKEIIQAQLQETAIPAPVVPPVDLPVQPRSYSGTEPHVHAPTNRVDLREEVIDPSFDFEGPKMDMDEI